MLHLSALHPPYPQPHFDTPPLTRHHPAPAHPRAGVWGYWSTDGLGLFEYMLLAEELGADANDLVISVPTAWVLLSPGPLPPCFRPPAPHAPPPTPHPLPPSGCRRAGRRHHAAGAGGAGLN